MIQRIDEVDGPPVVWRYYLVPTVRYPLWGHVANWPVMGVRHTDVEHLDFKPQHYHFDHRFFTPTEFKWVVDVGIGTAAIRAHAIVLSEYEPAPPAGFGALPAEPVWMRKRCYREAIPYPSATIAAESERGFPALWRAFHGRQARRNEHGHWVCPHRQYPLGNARCENGVITCPLHGLRINADTGIVESEGYFAKPEECAA